MGSRRRLSDRTSRIDVKLTIRETSDLPDGQQLDAWRALWRRLLTEIAYGTGEPVIELTRGEESNSVASTSMGEAIDDDTSI